MTGYGKAELNLKKSNFTIELKSLNSKQIDINIKIPPVFKDKEINLRQLLAKKLQRGKIELSIWRERSESSSDYNINTSVVKEYHNQILKLKKDLNLKSSFWSTNFYELGLNKSDIIPTLLKMPNALIKNEIYVDKDEWEEISKGIDKAINKLLQFQINEGNILASDISNRIDLISNLLLKIDPFEKDRISKIKENLSEKISKLNIKSFDESRFEQEVIYYLEKQDITEEKVRLSSHLNYFLETMKTESPNGKKLIFISQEIGREINTLGSKSSNSEMQKIVVEMKDELEKIKEQLLNIL